MEFITKNLKQAGIFNTILIVCGVVYDVVRIFSARNVYSTIAIVLQLVAYCFALNYGFKGYKKNAAKSYKGFLCAYALSIIATAISSLMSGKTPISAFVVAAIRFILIVLLAFVKDLGRLKSYLLAEAVFISNIDSIISQLTKANSIFRALFTTLSGLILSAVLCVFVIAKYRDKESRGTK